MKKNRKPKVFLFDGIELNTIILKHGEALQITSILREHILRYIETIFLGTDNAHGFIVETCDKFNINGHAVAEDIERYLKINDFGVKQILEHIVDCRQLRNVSLVTTWKTCHDYRITVIPQCVDREFEEYVRKWCDDRKEKGLFVPYLYLEIGNLP